MSIRLRKWNDQDGTVQEAWGIDIKLKLPGLGIVRVRKACPINTKRGAQQFEHQTRQSLLDGSFFKQEVVVRPVVMTLTDFAPRFMESSEVHNKPSSVAAKRGLLKCHILPVLGSKALDSIRPVDVEMLKVSMLKTTKAKTVNNALAVLRRMLNLAVDWELIPNVPKVKALKIPPQDFQFLDFEEAERLLAKAQPEWHAMMALALGTGLRAGELLALKWEDIDLKQSQLVVRRSLWRKIEVPPKNNKARHIPLGPTLCSILAKHRHLRGAYVFCQEDGTRLSHSLVEEIVPNACRTAGLAKRVTWHDLRHSFASHLAMRGASLKAIQELLGHASLDMTLRYAHLTPDIRRDAVLLLEPQQARGTLGAHSS